jgi:hypothetical protein
MEAQRFHFQQLGVEPQQVIPGQAESADGWLVTDTGMTAVPVEALGLAVCPLEGEELVARAMVVMTCSTVTLRLAL